MKPYIFDYIGFATVDKRLSSPMLPWIIAQIHRGTSKKKVKICVEGNNVNGYGGDGWREQVFSHPLQLVSRPTMLPGDSVSFLYIVKDTSQPLLYVHLFQTTEPDDVMELFAAMREQPLKSGSAGGPTGRSLSNASSLTTLCPDISPSSSHFFEVLYIGKIKVLHKKVPDTFIDDALDKFQEIEKEKREKEALLLNHNHTQESEGAGEIQLLSSAGSGKSSTGTFGSTETLKSDANNETAQKPRMRKRSGSAGSVLIKRPETLSVAANAMQEHNRTMVFQVGRNDIRLISPDRKQVLLHKHLKDITYSVQGSKRTSHFAFICREMNSESQGFIGYVFKCQSPSVSEDVVSAISQALTSEACKKQHQAVVSCEHCPMVWYHKLCAEVEGLGERGAQGAILRRLELLPEEEQSIVQTKLQGALESSSNPKEQVELLMMILRTHCESKQSRHVHDTLENRHEFLNHYLGGGTIFMKAKRSLTNSFDQLLKRKGSRDDFGPILKEFSLPANATLCKDAMSGNSDNGEMNQEGSLEEKSGPMMNIFLQVGNSPVKSHEDIEEDLNSQPSSWRQAIFNTVVTPSKTIKPAVKDKEFYRALWKKAINQQVLLIRMEKENARLTARQEEANVKRIKLEYDELGVCESNDIWDIIVTRESDHCDPNLLNQALQKGIPKGKRGEVWMYLADKFCSKLPPVDTTKFPNYNVPYDDLLRQLTSHQHAILIDLGRTFPNHVYYSSPLGPGQLALFNLLKAYSLLDPEVGYCQGLSFIAGVLLLHMSEGEAFVGLKHVMFRRGLRARYLPDMAALQVQLYQLSRLLHDHLPKLYAHFDSYEVSPTLYAAPWLLTIFASQFPLGFVTRVFDVIFAESTDVLFKIALALLDHHKEGLLACDSFELIMDYLKNSVPNIDAKMMNKIMKDVLSRDISKELTEYGVEYHVLQEEMASPRPETKKIKQLEAINKSLTSKNRALTEQLQIATSNINRLETSRSTHMAQINKLESEVRSMEVTVSTLGEFISSLAYNKTDIEIPSEILRIITQVNLSERRKNNAKTGGDKLLKNTLRGVPLRVIDDNNHHHPPPLKFALSSPNLTSKVSNLFSHSGQRPQNRLSPLKDSSDAENTQFKKSLSDAQEMCPNKDLLKSKSAERLDVSKFGRILTTQDRKALRLSETDKTETDKGVDTDSKKRLLKTSQSSYELKSATHPLDSDGVTISFEGTTKLKTLGPARPRPLSSEQDVELKIIEHKNTAPDKLKLTIDKVTHLFGSIPDPEFSKNQVEFEKPRGKETELMIQSQAPANKTGVLT